MRRRTYLLGIYLWIMAGVSVIYASRFPSFDFKHFTVEDGLVVNTVTHIMQDSRGFMWFCTSGGLSCYDGRTFKQFIPTADSEKGTSMSSVLCIREGAKKELLVGSTFGLYAFNPERETFQFVTFKTKDGVSITSRVYSICQDADNNLWIATSEQGVFHYEYDQKKLTQLTHDPQNPYSIPSNEIRSIFIDARGKVWILSFNNGIGCYDPQTGICRRYMDYGRNPIDRYDVMYEDKNNHLWLGNYSQGLSLLNPKTGEFTHFLTPQSDGYVNHVRSIIEYSPGLLLLASDNGLTYFDTATHDYRTLKADPFSYTTGLNDNYVHSLFVDKEGGLWVGTYFGGVNYSSPAARNFEHYHPGSGDYSFPGRIVGDMTEDEKGNLWIGTDDAGVIYFDTHQNSFRQYLPEKGKNSLSYHNIHALLCDKDKLWIGTYSGGLDCLNLNTGHFTHYTHDDRPRSLLHSSVYALHKDKRGVIWVGTPVGVCTYDAGTDSFTPMSATTSADIVCIVEDDYGYIWCASINNGLYRYNTATRKWRRFHYIPSKKNCSLPSDIITTLTIDSRKHLWIGTDGNGIARYKYDAECFETLATPVLQDTPIHRIIDHADHLWISTNKGLIRLQPKTLDYKLYNRSDGLQSIQFSPNSGLQTKDGMIYFGGINGFNRFSPNRLIENTVIPNVYITGLRLFNKNIHCGDDTELLDKAISYKDELTFRYNQSVIGFEFVTLSFFAPDKNQYAYMLEGFDKDWSFVQKSPIVSYTNLPAGEYVFRVKASNNDGLWNHTGTSLKIKVLPPWWLSSWAFASYIVVAGLILFGEVRHFKRKMERRHRENIDRINAEKEKIIYDTKINFFTNVIHEIRTPLSLIIAPLEHVMKSNKKVHDVKEDLLIIHRNSNRLLNLVNQLMDFRKVEYNGVSLKYVTLDISHHIRQLYERFVPNAQQHNVRLELFLPVESFAVKTDAEATTKILSNLLSNAIKFTKDKVTVTVRYLAEEQTIVVTVDDNGKGIPEAERENIFKPFYQIKENQPSDGIGTGVGLSLLRTLVMQLNGSIRVETSSMGGASFVLTLPLIKAEETAETKNGEASGNPAASQMETEPVLTATEADNENEKTESDAEPLSPQVPSVLLVDDNKDMLTFLSHQLDADYTAVTCESAVEAQEWLKDGTVDLIISDVMMPGIDGFEFCKQLKNNIETSHIPVILLTAKTDTEAKIEGLDNGADAYIEKPFSVTHLKAQIHSLLLNRHKIQQRFATQPAVPVASLVTNKADAIFLQKVDEFISGNMGEIDFTSGDIAVHMGMCRSSFFSKLRLITGQTPNSYIQLLRLKKAVEHFHDGETRINEVSYRVGFNSPSYFTKCFQQQFGELPTEYVKKLADQARPY